MSLTIIEINDSEIRAANKGEIISRNPGFAVLKSDRIETGTNAWKICRSNPRETTSKYWSQLNQDALNLPSRLARHHADLAYRQLMAIHIEAGSPEEVLFAVPGSFNRDQLALLLGIVEACPFKAVGLVDSAIAGTAAIAEPGEYLYLDIHLHFIILTTITVTDNVSRNTVKIIEHVGISKIYDTCAEYFSDLFIDQARFDPLHHAETEQALYNMIPEFLAKLNPSKENNLDIQYKNKNFQAKLSADLFLQKLQHHYDKIYSEIPESTMCLISDRLDVLPGFSRQISNKVIVEENSVFKGCLLNLDRIISPGDGGISLVTILPATSSPLTTASTTVIPGSETTVQTEIRANPTHLLINNRAYSLKKTPVFISTSGNISWQKSDKSQLSLYMNSKGLEVTPEGNNPVFINGKKASKGDGVIIGDTISLSEPDIEIKCIEVLSD